ncbi:hypothetical protein HDU97_002250 [Phlyctochytrium planicorne]|nr:hypothetical protein HDU97_002250 [Phlyctochytrium planicorne]
MHLKAVSLLLLTTLFSTSQALLPQKNATSIYLAFIFPYALNQSDAINDVRTIESAAELAVNEINDDATILPQTEVKIQRVNEWDPKYPNDYDSFDSGGYSLVAAINVTKQYNVTGAIGGLWDKTTIFNGEIFSHYKIPFCGASQTSLTLSDKYNYPYFFRMQPGTGIGNHLLLLLQRWNVTKVAMILGPDDRNTADANDIESTFNTNTNSNFSVTLLTKMEISVEALAVNDFAYPFQVISGLKARYIIVVANSTVTMQIYKSAMNYNPSLVGPNFVWIGTSPPYDSPSQVNPKDIQGFTLIKSDRPGTEVPAVRNFQAKWAQLNAANSTKYAMPNGDIPRYAAEGYDCVKTMLIGMTQVMRSRNATAKDLASGLLKDYMDYSLFKMTNYTGVTYDPIQLNDQGSSIAPLDSPIPIVPYESVNNLNSGGGITLVVLEVLGISFSIICFVLVIVYRDQKVFKTASPPFCIVFVLGTLLSYLSNVFFIGTVNKANCELQLWLPLLGFSMVFGSIIVKNARVYYLFNNKHGALLKLMKDPPLLAASFLFVAIETILLAIRTGKMDIQPTKYVNSEEMYIYVCSSNDPNEPKIVIALYVYNVSLIVLAGYLSYLTRNVHASYSESVFMSAVVVAFVFVGSTILPILLTMEPSAWNIMIRTVAVWVLTSFTLVSMFGSKVLTIYFAARNAPRGESTLGSASGSKRGAYSKGVETDADEDDAKLDKEEVKSFKFLDLGGIIFQIKTTPFWSRWYEGYLSINRLGERVWIAVEEPERARALHLSPQIKVTTENTYVHIDNPAAEVNKLKIKPFKIRLEYETPEMCDQFVQKFKGFFDSNGDYSNPVKKVVPDS